MTKQDQPKTQGKIEDLRKKISPIIGALNNKCWYKARNNSKGDDSFLTTVELNKFRDDFVDVFLQQQNDLLERVLEIVGEDEDEKKIQNLGQLREARTRNYFRYDLRIWLEELKKSL